jgi:hypothetical protein
VDDHSRYVISCTLHENIAVIEVLNKLYELVRKGRKTSKILVDPGPQFRNMFVRGCKELGIEVERCIRTFNERISKAR